VGDNTNAAMMNAGPPGLAAFENLNRIRSLYVVLHFFPLATPEVV